MNRHKKRATAKLDKWRRKQAWMRSWLFREFGNAFDRIMNGQPPVDASLMARDAARNYIKSLGVEFDEKALIHAEPEPGVHVFEYTGRYPGVLHNVMVSGETQA